VAILFNYKHKLESNNGFTCPKSASDAPLRQRQPRRLFKEVLVSSSPAVKDDGGWVKVVSRQSLRQRQLPSAPPSSVYPINLQGNCFKCLSPSHHVASRRCSVRCFLCQLPGHRAYVCLQRRKAPSSSRRSLVIRPALWRHRLVAWKLPQLGSVSSLMEVRRSARAAVGGRRSMAHFTYL
jgi:hypothetical protein